MGTNVAKMLAANGQMLVDVGDGSGARLFMSDNDPLRGTYAAFIYGYTPPANPTDVLMIQGSASRIIRVRAIVVTGTATAASNIGIYTVRRSTPNTGGTVTNPALIARDNNDAVATALISLYSVLPTGLGTLLGNADGGRLNIAPAANGGIDRLALQYSWLNDKAPILRGVNDCLCINLGGSAWPAGGQLDFNIVLSEDANPAN